MIVVFLMTMTVIPVIEASTNHNVVDHNSNKNLLRHGGNDLVDDNSGGGGDDDDDNTSSNTDNAIYLSAIVTIDHVVPPIADDGKTLLGWNRDVITKALIHADNKINTNSRYHVQSAFIEKYIDYPEDGNYCPEENHDDDDDDDKSNLGRAPPIMGDLYWYWMSFGCGFMCRPDDDDSFMSNEQATTTTTINDKNNKIMTQMDLFVEVTKGRTPENHKVLEAELCKELRESGEHALSTVTKCTIDFVYSDDKYSNNALVGGRRDGSLGPSFASTTITTSSTSSSSTNVKMVSKVKQMEMNNEEA